MICSSEWAKLVQLSTGMYGMNYTFFCREWHWSKFPEGECGIGKNNNKKSLWEWDRLDKLPDRVGGIRLFLMVECGIGKTVYRRVWD